MSSLLLNPVSRGAFSGLEPPAPTFTIGANQIARLDPAAPAPTSYVVRAPADPWEGAAFAVLDTTGAAALHPVTVQGNGNTIDGAASVQLDTARALGVWVFTGSEWRRVGAPTFELQGVDAAMAFNFFDPTPPSTLAKIAESTTAGEAYADAVAAAAEAAAIASASADATTKANAAQANAIAAAAADATTKANAAQANAIAASSQADRVQIAGLASAAGTTLTAGNYTTATRFFVDRAATLTGVRFWWPGGASRTIKVSLWDAAGVRLASTTVAVNAAGLYVATFAAALTAGVIYRVSLWDNSGVSYLKTTSAAANVLVPARIFAAGGGLYYEAITYFGAGDTFPNGTGSEAYLMDPLVTT